MPNKTARVWFQFERGGKWHPGTLTRPLSAGSPIHEVYTQDYGYRLAMIPQDQEAANRPGLGRWAPRRKLTPTERRGA